MLAYGIPMMLGYEVSGLILSIGDRYVIQATIGGVPLGIYAAAYNVCQYVDTVFIASVSQAIMPIYMRIWSESGEAATRKFLDDALRYFVILALPVGTGLAAVGSDFLPFVASEKYASGAVIIPFVMTGVILAEMNTIVGAGLFIQRRTDVIGSLVVGGAALNIGLNLYLVPRLGILGAAVATLVSYAALTAATGFFGFRRLALALPWAATAKAAVAAAAMYLAVRPLQFHGRVGTLVAKSAVGAITYGALVMALDQRTRDAVVSAARRLGQ
jgi:O-antigen/teichoic acid export membrane protein